MVKAEKRLGRKFTPEEVEDGTMGALLIESDFDTEKTVSRFTSYLFHSYSCSLDHVLSQFITERNTLRQ